MIRAALVALLVAVLALITACGSSDDPDRPRFPVRLLPAAPPLGFVSLIEPDFGGPDALDPWYVLEMDGEGKPAEIVPAALHPRVAIDGNALVLQPGTGVLFRYVEVPEDMLAQIRVRLTTTAGSGEEHCPLTRGPFLAPMDEGFQPRELVAMQADAAEDHEVRKLFHRFAARILNYSKPKTGFTWGDAVPEGTARLAEARFRTKEVPELRALCLRNTDDVLRIEEVGMGQAPALRRNDVGGQVDLPISEGNELIPRQVSLAGEQRPAIRISAGTSVTLEADLPPDAARLTLGVVAPPSDDHTLDATPDELRWTVELEGAPGSFDTEWVANRSLATSIVPSPDDPREEIHVLELGSGTERSDETPVRWHDVALDWPLGSPGGSTRLTIRVEGSGHLLVAQPMAHGPVPVRPALPEEDPPPPGDPTRPNLLLLSIDTLRADHTGWHGYERPTTPSLDALADTGTVFERCMSVGPYTLPSHATLLSGLFPIRHGARETTDRVGEHVPTLATLLASRGWATAAFTGGGFLSPDYGFSNGFDRYQSVDPIHNPEATGGLGRFSIENRDHEDELNTLHSLDSVGQWIDSHADGPWFAFVHTYVAHEYRPPAEDFALFDTQPETSWGLNVQPQLSPRAWVTSPPADADLEHLINLYDASIHFVDREIGALLERLEREGLLENTVVVLTSDHGEEFFEHGHLRHSQSLYEEMLHVPLVIRVPGQTTGSRISEPVHIADITPTVLSALGLPVPPHMDGVSRRSHLEGADGAEHAATEMYATVETHWSRRASVRLGDIKLIRGDTSPELTYPSTTEWELYDLGVDPQESDNIFEQSARQAAMLQNRLESLESAQQEQAQPASQAEVSQELKDQLKALGYVDGG